MRKAGLRISTRLVIGFVLIALMGGASSLLAIWYLKHQNAASSVLYERDFQLLSSLKDANNHMLAAGRAARTALLATTKSKRESSIKAVANSLKSAKDSLDAAQKLSNSTDKNSFTALMGVWQRYTEANAKLVALIAEQSLIETNDGLDYMFGEGAVTVVEMQKLIASAIASKEASIQSQYEDNERLYKASVLQTVAISAATVLLSIGFGVYISRSVTVPLKSAINSAQRIESGDMTGFLSTSAKDEVGELLQAIESMRIRLNSVVQEVRQGSETVAEASIAIASGNVNLRRKTDEQAEAVRHTAATMSALAKTVRINAESASAAGRLVVDANRLASDGNTAVEQVVQAMQGITVSSAKISDITTVIDSLAFQTNILALNAAIEAARAGQHGRGFGVVASEVRVLAERSAEAAKQIRGLVAESEERVSHGNDQVQVAGAKMVEIRKSFGEVASIVNEIGNSSAQQAASISTVESSILQIGRVASENAMLVEGNGDATSQLRDLAVSLVGSVSSFKVATEEELSGDGDQSEQLATPT